MKRQHPFLPLILLASAFLLRPDTSVTADDPKQPTDLVAREIRMVRAQIQTLSTNERDLKEDLSALRGKLKDSQSRLEELEARRKGPAEIDMAQSDFENLRADVSRQESLLVLKPA